MIQRAREFALKAHGSQKYGDKPYIHHIDAVVSHLSRYDEAIRVIAYLHDVVEDTPITLADIEQEFGKFIADCVAIVTDEEGRNRKERKAKTYRKMAQVRGELEAALIVKAADRLANLRTCLSDANSHRINLYKSEHPAFKNAVYRENLCDELWIQLELAISRAHGGR